MQSVVPSTMSVLLVPLLPVAKEDMAVEVVPVSIINKSRYNKIAEFALNRAPGIF